MVNAQILHFNPYNLGVICLIGAEIWKNVRLNIEPQINMLDTWFLAFFYTLYAFNCFILQIGRGGQGSKLWNKQFDNMSKIRFKISINNELGTSHTWEFIHGWNWSQRDDCPQMDEMYPHQWNFSLYGVSNPHEWINLCSWMKFTTHVIGHMKNLMTN
jgi:hypothetical protein